MAPLSFPLRGILFLLGVLIVPACALFPIAALVQSKEVGLLSIQIVSFVPMFGRHLRVWCVCVCGCKRWCVHAHGYYVRLYVYSGCVIVYVLWNILNCLCVCASLSQSLSLTFPLRGRVPAKVVGASVCFSVERMLISTTCDCIVAQLDLQLNNF